MDLKSTEYEPLTQKLKDVLPISACAIREILHLFKDTGDRVKLTTKLEIIDVYNSGDISGIMCIVTPDSINKLACALTHLIIPADQPLYNEIIDYQKKRVKRVKHLVTRKR